MVRALALSFFMGAAVAADPVLPHYAKDKSLGVASCASSLCHGSIEPWKDSQVRQDEYVIWSRNDRHARAYSTLLSERSTAIVRRLGLKQPAVEAQVCLDCHAHNVPEERRQSGFVLSDGIMCEACHGPAERWIRSHVEPGAKSAANYARGMYPTADDVARARLCLGCHFGNAEKLVTHRMMAAGHPRLSFELDTFSAILPAHFRTRWDGVRLWALGQAIAAEELLALFTHPRRGRDGLFPELVLFDCHACHHAMSDKRDGSARIGAAPGTVRLNDANLLMVRHIARRVDPAFAETLARDIARLHAGLAGNDALTQARAVQRSLGSLVPRIAAYSFSRDDLRAVFAGLVDDGLAGQYGDYQGAEQAAMALQSLADFMSRHGMLKSAPLKPAMAQVMAAVESDEKYAAPRFVQALRELRARFEASAKP